MLNVEHVYIKQTIINMYTAECNQYFYTGCFFQ